MMVVMMRSTGVTCRAPDKLVLISNRIVLPSEESPRGPPPQGSPDELGILAQGGEPLWFVKALHHFQSFHWVDLEWVSGGEEAYLHVCPEPPAD